jgi:AcrR family transcriptional regulator
LKTLKTAQTRESKGKNTYKRILDVAKKLYRQVGFQKTTIADISSELQMSPANVYRFFAAKAKINEAICEELLANITTEAARIAQSAGTASQRLRNLIRSVENSHQRRFLTDRKLHELIDAAAAEDWDILRRHTKCLSEISAQIIAGGMDSGEFPRGDASLAARLVTTACIWFCHPGLIAEYDQERDPTLDEMIRFCLGALQAGNVRSPQLSTYLSYGRGLAENCSELSPIALPTRKQEINQIGNSVELGRE